MAWLENQPTRERPDTFTQTGMSSGRTLHRRGETYISLDDVLKHFPVQGQIGNSFLEPVILVFQLSQAFHL